MKTFLQYQKSLILIFVAAIFSIPVMAEKIPADKAGRAAANFLKAKYEAAGYQVSSQIELETAFVYTAENQLGIANKSTEDPLFYIFNLDKEAGFVILSADDRVMPVLGYSLSQDFTGDNLPDALVYMLEGYAEQISELINSQAETGIRAKSQWADLFAGNDNLLYKSVSAVNPLVSTTWGQSPYYNDLCPYDNQYQQLTVTGCVATAMSQIMKYWEHPAQGIGYHSYDHDTYGTQSANFSSQTYNWSAMPNNLNGPNEQVAIIMQHCGVAVDMDYGVAETGGSAAYVISNASPVQHCVEYSLKEYFDYSTDMQGVIREYYDDATWLQMMKSDLDAGRPIQYAGFGAGGGHTWVCDGYDNSNLFHMNWGWGGVYDGYYSLDNLAPGVGGAGGGSGSFTSGQQALIGIEPTDGGGGGGSSSAFDLRAYSEIVVDPNPINFTGAFSVTVDIANFEEENFSGNLAAVLFNSDGDFVDFVQEINDVLFEPGYYYTIAFENEGLLATPGDYYVGIYYMQTGGEYLIIGNGEYSNYAATSIVGPDNDMQMYSAMVIDPQPIISGQAFEIVFDVANFGSSDFSGLISADLYDMEGNYLEELVSGDVELASDYYGTLTLTIGGVDVEAGSYILAIWDQPDGSDWQLVGSDEFPNPVTVEIAAPGVQPDPYEDNNEQGVAFNFPLNLSGNTAVVSSEGSTIHEGNDLDYYKLDLPQGSQYKFDVRVHDSYNSGNGMDYTNDVLWAFIVDDEVSEAFDDVAPWEFVVNGGNTIYFVVSNYYQGNTGTYLLDMTIESGIFAVEEIVDEDFAKVYPNPSQGEISLDVKSWEEVGLPATIEVNNYVGQIVFRSEVANPNNFQNKLLLNDLENGFYTLKVSGKEKFFDKQIIIMK